MATISPKLSISTQRRLRVAATQAYDVHGVCAPEPSDSLAAAKLYCLRESKKLSGGHLRPFVPTHTITHPKRRIHVRMVEGACFTEGEWQPCTHAGRSAQTVN